MSTVEETLIVGPEFSKARTRQVVEECQRGNVTVKRVRVHIEELTYAGDEVDYAYSVVLSTREIQHRR